ncbi:fimbrial protein [Pseudomonas asplenii]|uniref:fimbrial protein n=1 Tax=Pseudomonas asplenii TaxID=53407 RepID=UPI0006B47F13|nr:type 1 fimbrial protein [Pseudomonas fuscovaginae]KPA99480.1 P pilus assembly protein, pilin FimA [Pseudomonas fuscovaginae]
MKGSIRLFVVLVTGLSLPPLAQAGCDYYPSTRNGATFPSTITVPVNLPVGGLIARAALSTPYPSGISQCTTSVLQQTIGRYTAADWVNLGNGISVYRTNVPGVGVRIHSLMDSGTPYTTSLQSSTTTLPPRSYNHFLTSMEAQFYKTGNVSTGTVPAGNLHQNNWDGRLISTILLHNSVQFVAQSPTCDLAVGDVNRTINLDKIQLSNFTGNSAGKYNFEISANCNNASSVTFRFTGTPANGDSYRFANTGTAPGVGTWLYSRIGGVESTIRANGTENTRTVSVSANRAVLPLGAAYWKIGTPGKGTLVSAVTVNITYN